MPVIVKSPRAESDLVEIWDFIADDSKARKESARYPAVKKTIEEQEVIRELESVVLTRGIPEHSLRRGDIGAVAYCYEDGAAFEVEFVTARGDTVAVITLESKDVRPMHPNEILHAREIKAA